MILVSSTKGGAGASVGAATRALADGSPSLLVDLTGDLTARHMGAGTARSIGAGAVALACTAREQGENAERVHARGGHGVEADLDRRAVVEVDVARVPLRGERAHLAPLDLVLVASEPETDLEIL